MLTKQIATQINTEEIKFRSGQPASLEINATNYSNRLASFWLEITAAGVKQGEHPNWYRVSPGISTLNPPGDSTKFKVTIMESPIPGFVGQINLTLKIFSLELNTEERQVVRLIVERESNQRSLQLELLNPQPSFEPASTINIPFRVFNSSQKPVKVTLSLLGLNPQWFKGKTEQTFNLPPEKWLERSFQGKLPPLEDVLAGEYSFKLNTSQPQTEKLSIAGSLTILPEGTVRLKCDHPEVQIPPHRPWLPNWRSKSTSYQFDFINHSNLNQQVSFVPIPNPADCQWEISPEQSLSLKESTSLELVARVNRPWWGWRRIAEFPISGKLSDSRIPLKNEQQNLTLTVHPILPTWLQGLAGLILLGMGWWVWTAWFRLPSHQGRINAIDVNGMADRVISVADDRQIRSWEIAKFRTRSNKIIGKTPKSIRSVRYQPVNNHRVALGLQNGEVQLWDLLSKQSEPLFTFSDNRADRVLGLEFTPNSRYLFSGHGSGLILQWDLTSNHFDEPIDKPIRSKQLSPPSAIYGLAIVGREQDTLAIAGQYNDLKLWNWQSDELLTLNYRSGNQDDYITSLATAEHQPYLLATGDNQGAISLWNLRPCLAGTDPCELLDFWQDGHAEQPIRAVALNANGCSLATSGDDGKLKLWSLGSNYQRQSQYLDGAVVKKLNTKLNSIDIKQKDSQLQITTGGDDGKVRVYRQQVDDRSCSS
ncbi:MAG: WD40 repeat domain-containing protein [Cyanobacteria bacterium P01_A01_bin.40]